MKKNMKKRIFIFRLLGSIVALGFFSTVKAAAPVWTFTPLTPTSLNISAFETAIVKYTLTNQSKKQHTLTTTPIPGVTQDTSAGICTNPVTLNYQQSCTLSFVIAGSAMTGNIEGGPIVCEQGGTFLCNRPSAGNTLRVTARTIAGPSIAVGYYTDTSAVRRPFVAVSSNAGSTWSFPTSITEPNTTPAFSSTGIFFGTGCKGNTCIATGRYVATDTIQRPLVGVSTNAGETWSYPPEITNPNTIPAFNGKGVLLLSSCDGSTCISGGQYRDTSNTDRPLLALSTNAGTTWSYPEAITNLTTTPAFSGNGRLESGYCHDRICITSGQYNDSNGVQRPLMALSYDTGTTWTFPRSITEPNTTPAFNSGGQLFVTSCHSSTCITTGGYTDINAIQRPLLALSTDTGNTWTFPQDITNLTTTPSFSSDGLLIGTSCHNSTCIAVGYYTDTSAVKRPLLALSTNTGSTWTYPEGITNLTVTPAFSSNGQLLSASCPSNTCIAVGFYYDSSSTQHPLLALSTDTGATWSFPGNITQPTITPAFSSGRFSGVSCEDHTCFAAGEYFDTNAISHPLLAVSVDAGHTWTFSDSITEPTTAPTFSEGALTQTSVQ